MNRIGDKIKALRNESKMTQKALAKKLGVSESFINEIEMGRKVASESIITRAEKVFGKSLDDIIMYDEEKEEKHTYKPLKVENIDKKKTEEIWDEAFGSILKNIPVYKMDMKTVESNRQLPIVSNKIEGFAQDKVFYLKVEDNDMIGFRIAAGDIAFAHKTKEIENNAINLIEFNDNLIIRQIKIIDKNKLLLISNSGSLRTETVGIKNINVLAKITKVEIML